MKKALNIWLWIIFVVNIIAAAFNVFTILVSPLNGILTLACAVVFIVGVGLLLFRQVKLGFYLMCAAQAAMLVIDVVAGANIILAIISAAVVLLITWFFMKDDWASFK